MRIDLARGMLIALLMAANKVIATVPVGQAPQALVYVPGAAPADGGRENLMPLGLAGEVAHIALAPAAGKAQTNISLFNQGLVQVLQGAVTGLRPKSHYMLGLSDHADGSGKIITTVGPIRQIVDAGQETERKHLVIAEGTSAAPGAVVQTVSK